LSERIRRGTRKVTFEAKETWPMQRELSLQN
jgi:hypothetical protein